MKSFVKFLYVLSLTAFFVACGGGGGGGGGGGSIAPPLVADYTVLQLDPLPGHTTSLANDLNDMGQIVGSSAGGGVPRTAVLWTIDGAGVVTVQDLGTLPGRMSSLAYGINNLGQVVGVADPSVDNGRPFIWTASGGMRDLGVPVSVVGGEARRINDAGQVVGVIGGGQVAIWTVDADGNVLDERNLGNLGGVRAMAFDNNVQGNIAGDIFFAASQTAFFWSEADGVVEIDTEEALGINDFNEVVGVRTSSGNNAYVWSAAGGLTEISGGVASAINNSSQVTGRPNSGGPAFLWDGGVYKNLPKPENRGFGWGLSINDAGWIVGWSASDVDGISHANLWLPN